MEGAGADKEYARLRVSELFYHIMEVEYDSEADEIIGLQERAAFASFIAKITTSLELQKDTISFVKQGLELYVKQVVIPEISSVLKAGTTTLLETVSNSLGKYLKIAKSLECLLNRIEGTAWVSETGDVCDPKHILYGLLFTNLPNDIPEAILRAIRAFTANFSGMNKSEVVAWNRLLCALGLFSTASPHASFIFKTVLDSLEKHLENLTIQLIGELSNESPYQRVRGIVGFRIGLKEWLVALLPENTECSALKSNILQIVSNKTDHVIVSHVVNDHYSVDKRLELSATDDVYIPMLICDASLKKLRANIIERITNSRQKVFPTADFLSFRTVKYLLSDEDTIYVTYYNKTNQNFTTQKLTTVSDRHYMGLTVLHHSIKHRYVDLLRSSLQACGIGSEDILWLWTVPKMEQLAIGIRIGNGLTTVGGRNALQIVNIHAFRPTPYVKKLEEFVDRSNKLSAGIIVENGKLDAKGTYESISDSFYNIMKNEYIKHKPSAEEMIRVVQLVDFSHKGFNVLEKSVERIASTAIKAMQRPCLELLNDFSEEMFQYLLQTVPANEDDAQMRESSPAEVLRALTDSKKLKAHTFISSFIDLESNYINFANPKFVVQATAILNKLPIHAHETINEETLLLSNTGSQTPCLCFLLCAASTFGCSHIKPGKLFFQRENGIPQLELLRELSNAYIGTAMKEMSVYFAKSVISTMACFCLDDLVDLAIGDLRLE